MPKEEIIVLQPIFVEPGKIVVQESNKNESNEKESKEKESKEKASKGHAKASEKNVRDQSKADKEVGKKGTATSPSKPARSSSTTVSFAMYRKYPVYRVAQVDRKENKIRDKLHNTFASSARRQLGITSVDT